MPASRRPPEPSELGRLIRNTRLDAGMTQEDLAAAVERSQEWVGKVESGEIAAPRDESLRRLAVVLRIGIADLVLAMQRADNRRDAERVAVQLSGVADGGGETIAAGLMSVEDIERERLIELWSVLSPERRTALIDFGNFLRSQETGKPRGARVRQRKAG